jgi:hypothetical protein
MFRAIKFFSLLATLVLCFSLACDAFAQGKGKGNSGGQGRGNSGSSANSGRGSADVDKGKEDRGKGRDDRDDDRSANDRGRKSGEDGNNHRYDALGRKLNMSGESVRDWYEREKQLNPDLTYGNFVAANMIARNHGSRYPNLTTEAILRRMRDGESLGQAMKNLGVNDRDIKQEKKRIKKEIKKHRDEVGDDNDDADFRTNW